MVPPVLASIGDNGVLNERLTPELSEVWIDRDLSWLAFNERVLAEAIDGRTPLLERAKFLAIFNSNLDEFFMKRDVHYCAGDEPRSSLHGLFNCDRNCSHASEAGRMLPSRDYSRSGKAWNLSPWMGRLDSRATRGGGIATSTTVSLPHSLHW